MPLSRGLIAAGVRNPVFANLAAMGILVAGIISARGLPRETFPETALDHLTVTVPYPGATPADVEQGICIKIEQAIEGIPGISEVSSVSAEGLGTVIAEFDPSVAPTAEVLRQVQDQVNSITTFPDEAERPIVSERIIRNPVIRLGIYGNAPEQTLKRLAQDIRKDLMANRLISQVSLAGVRDYEISIRLSEQALQRYGLGLQEIINAIKQSSLDLPAGTIRTRFEEINVRTIGQRYDARDFENLVVVARPDGTSIRLGQIATVKDTFEETPVFGRVNGEPGVMITIAKTGTEDTSKIAAVVRAYVKATKNILPDGIHLSISADASRDIDARLTMLVRNGVLGLALVIVSLLLFLDYRSSLSVAFGILVSFAGAIAVMQVTGSTLNMISLLGLLMATGIIVDDAIVIAESVRAGARQGLTPEMAAIDGVHRIALPVLVSSVTTIIAFVPLMYVAGVMGKMIFVLPVVMIAAIVASAVEAFAILPAHLCAWSPRSEGGVAPWRIKVRRAIDRFIDHIISDVYRKCLRWTLGNRGPVLCGTLAVVLICVGTVRSGKIPFVLFPKIDGNTLRARVRFPEGTPADVGRAVIQRMERAANGLNDSPELSPSAEGKLVQHIYSVGGEWAEFVPLRGAALAETTIELMPAESRRLDCAKITEHWRRAIGPVPDALTFTISRQELGPTDKPIEFRLMGDDLIQLRQAADELKARLARFDGVFDVEDDLLPGKRELQVSLKPAAHNLGLTVADLASQLRDGLYGGEAVRLQRGNDEVKVMVSYVEQDRRNLSAIEDLRIRTRAGAEIPFLEVADTKMVRGYAQIGRQDGRRRIRVRADVDERNANAEKIIQQLEADFLPDFEAKYADVTVSVDGQRQRIVESLSSLGRASFVAFVVMFALLGTVLRSYLHPAIIMAAIPLGIVGSVLGHAVTGYDLTLMSVFGMVALGGIVVNDSLVLVDRVNRNLRDGMGVREAVTAAGASRFRAVVLTSVTTVAGLLPLLTERSSQAQSLIPMAISIAFGLMFATVLTLFIIPALFLFANDLKRTAHWLRHGGHFPSAEMVE